MSSNIVLVGAPGSGKSELAVSFADLVEEELGKFHILDNVATDIQESLDRPVGIYGTYLDNMLIAVRRFDAEMILRQANIPFISVGSVIETMAHSAQNVEILSAGVVTADTQKFVMRESVTTTALSFMFLDTFRYTYGFYLPLGEQIEIPAQRYDESNSYRYNIDRNILTIQENFGLGLQALRGTVDDMAQQMLDSIRRTEALREEALAELAESPLVEAE